MNMSNATPSSVRGHWFGVFLALLLAALAWPGPAGWSRAAEAASASAFSDIAGHWAAEVVERARDAGYVAGYPDGTFRPDAHVTRAEFVKMAVAAGKLHDRSPDSYKVFFDTADHWVEKQGYIARAGTYGLLDPLQYGSVFEPDKPISRLEAVVITMGLLGRRYQAENLSGKELAITDADLHPGWARGWIEQALVDGVVKGYPDGSFKGGQAVTRAEAVTMVERALDAMTRGIDPDLRLEVNGETVPYPASLAIRDGYVYAPAGAIYGSLANTEALCSSDSLFRVFPGNGCYKYALARLLFPVGAPFALACASDEQVGDNAGELSPLLAPSYVLYGELMIPVAPVAGDGTFPYGRGRHDPSTATVYVDIEPSWPGNNLPGTAQQAQLRLHDLAGAVLQPGYALDILRPTIQDHYSNEIVPDDPLVVQFSVDPSSPLRLRRGRDGALVTEVTVTYDFSSVEVGTPLEVAVDAPPDEQVPEGTFNVMVEAPGYPSAKLAVTVADRRPYRLSLDPVPDGTAGEPQTVTVKLLDNRGRVVDATYRSEYGIGPRLWVVTPDGSTVEATPRLTMDPGTGRSFILVNGVATFTYTPVAPGVYQYKALFQLPGSSGQPGGDMEAFLQSTVR